ncbi:MAG: Sensor histidine kinase YycG [Pelotomaculum sp. PtaB.Bin013]|uniref:histidine kinase n=1 Tax=Pelotomaculum isophthalicicum JI TaxID=947010 RepID=A0A9X4GZZ3_9FIRM|nr:ATP-binding protein [Pelotomaculum isophthalicicum]MDF9409335.1 ATP-binding protein [Pelotomaculum isophthalicicum JI]OPX91840.1 MAG: Sensor histidine kinase YycG [Pelotomaculum sp. PtaB.Bin013]
MRNSLFSKLMVSYLVIALVTLAVVGIAISQLFANYFYTAKERELERKGQEMTRIVAVYLEGGQAQPMNFLLNTVGTFLDARLTVIDKEVLQQGGSGIQGFPQLPLTSEEAKQVLEGKTVVLEGKTIDNRGFAQRHEQVMLSVAVPVQTNNGVVGALILTAPVSGMTATVNAVRVLILYAALGAVLLSAMLGFWLSRSISRPLSQMSEVTREMARGNFRQRVEVTSSDEVGQLAEDFNHLAGSLDQTISALSREKGKIENILTNMTEGVLAVDSSGQVILANEAVSRTLRVDPAEVLERPVSALSCCPGLAGLFSEVVLSGEPCSAEFEVNEGKTFIIAHLAPLRESVGGSYGVVGVLQDITELRKLELLRRDFVANVSHELRTPLTSIQGFLEALMDGTIDESQPRDRYLKVIHQETLRLNRLIHDLLDLAIIESGKMRWELNPIDVSDLVARVHLKLKPQIERQQVKVNQDVPVDLSLMLGNEDRIEQVLTNLLENAVRYSPPGGAITVKAVEEAGKITVEVADQGPGIPPEDLPYIWERFHRVEKSRSRNLGGTGLGLAIVKQIIEAHGGRVEVRSEVGQGSNFSFTLEVVPAEN